MQSSARANMNGDSFIAAADPLARWLALRIYSRSAAIANSGEQTSSSSEGEEGEKGGEIASL